MKAILQTFKWTERPKLSRDALFLIAIIVAGAITFFKLRPYFVRSSPVTVSTTTRDPKPNGLSSLLKHLSIGGSVSSKSASKNDEGSETGRTQRGRASERHAPSVIERPLFDGLTVVVRAVLLNAVSSLAPDATIEAKIESFVQDETNGDVDSSPAIGGKMTGVAAANMGLKRMNLNFSSLISSEGRSYPISGSAVDPISKMQGAEANYSSGMGTRLLGVTLDRAINLGDEVGMAKVLQSSTDNSVVSNEMQAASIEMNQQASTNISGEITKGMRETAAVMSLPAGTLITVRIKALSNGGT
jgi:hypothetical protein